MIPRIRPTAYPRGPMKEPQVTGGRSATYTTLQPNARMSDIHTFDRTPKAPGRSRLLWGAGTRSEVGRTPLGSNTSSSRGGDRWSGAPLSAQAGTAAGSLRHPEQTVAWSGSSSAQCGHTFTMVVFGRRQGSPYGKGSASLANVYETPSAADAIDQAFDAMKRR